MSWGMSGARRGSIAGGAVVLVGGSGRVGRMVRHHWPGPARLLSSHRDPAPSERGFVWSPLAGPTGLLDHLAQDGATPSALVMLAGVVPGPGQDAAALQANARLARACLAAARAAGIARVLLASSSAVYGTQAHGLPFAEADPPQPLSAYGRAKLEMETEADSFRQAGMQVCALRIGNVAGADALLAPLSASLLNPDAPRAPIQLHAFADGLGPLRSYIGAASLALVLARLADPATPLPPVLNIAAPEPLRMAALAKAADWPCQMIPAPPAAHQSITLDCTHLAALCPSVVKGNDPAAMVAEWKATLPR